MVWNFKLSLLPFVILIAFLGLFFVMLYFYSVFSIRYFNYIAYGVFFVGLFIWLLILPNSGYLITELNLNHREQDEQEVPIWYDIVSILSFALSGIFNTLTNIVLVQLTIIVAIDPEVITKQGMLKLIGTAVIINLFVAIGVYMGRYIRFNSWDILHPIQFTKRLWKHFKQKGVLKDFVLFVLFHTAFFTIMYFVLGLHTTFTRLM